MDDLTPAELDVLARLDGKEELHPFFFRKAKSLKWFYPLKSRGYFSQDKFLPTHQQEDGSFTVPFWGAAEYLAAASEQLRLPSSDEYAGEILSIIRSVTRHAKSRGLSNYRTWWLFSKAIKNIAAEYLSAEDIELADYWLNDPIETGLIAQEIGEIWMGQLLASEANSAHQIAEQLLSVLFRVEFGGPKAKTPHLRVPSWDARRIVEKNCRLAGRVIGSAASQVFVVGLEAIIQSNSSDNWSSIWRPSIEPDPQNLSPDDPEDILIDGLRISLEGVAESQLMDGHSFVERLLNSEFQTLKRVGIWAVDRRFEKFADLVPSIFSGNVFSSNFRHELWHLLNHRYESFSAETKELAKLRIESLTAATEDDGDESAGANAYRQAGWLASIRQYEPELEESYQHAVQIAGAEPERPDFSSYTTSGWVAHRSAYAVEELLSLDSEALARLLNDYAATYRPAPYHDAPDLEGLCKAVRQAVKTNPMHFHSLLGGLTVVETAYTCEIVEGYADLWRENAQLPWNSIWGGLLVFIEAVISRSDFWTRDKEVGESFVGNSRWFVSSVSRLIDAATRSDDHAIEEVYNEQLERILTLILKKQPGDTFSSKDGATSIAINSPRGQALEALINLVLRALRLASKHDTTVHDELWARFRPYFDLELAEAERYEFPTLVAMCLPNFLYMSTTWVYEKFDEIFASNHYVRWLCAMQGYASVGRVYEGIYKRLSEGGHFARALDDPNLKDRVVEKIIQNAVVAYMHEFEGLGVGLMEQILVRNRHSELAHIVWFVWTLRSSTAPKIKERVLTLWEKLLSIIDLGSRDGRLLASRLSTWIDFVEAITDETRPLIMAVARFTNENHNGYGFLKALARISKTQPYDAAEIWLEVLEGSAPWYPEEAIHDILGALVSQGSKGVRIAKEIAGKYAKAGIEMPAQYLLRKED